MSPSSADDRVSGARPGAGEPGTRWWRLAIGLLLIIYIFNFIDRQVMTILAEPIRRDLALQDWHLGVLTGLGFVLVYALMGIPIAWLADRYHRPTILAVSIAVWSVFTGLSGAAGSFGILLLCRIGVALGEAGCTPTAHSMISDYAPPGRRATALATYSLGNPLGLLVGLAVGGLVAQSYGWRTAFLMVALPGLLLAPLAYLLLPETGARRGPRVPKVGVEIESGQARTLWRKPSYWLMSIGVGFTTFLVSGPAVFVAPYLLRTKQEQLQAVADSAGNMLGITLLPIGFLGLALGLTIGLGGAAGTWIGGALADRLSVGSARRYMAVPMVGSAVAPVAFLFAWFAQDPVSVIIWTGLGFLMAATATGPVYAAVQSVASPSVRALAAAVMLLCLNLVGGLGPLVVGLLSDLLADRLASGEALRVALLVSTVSGLIGSGLFFAAGRRLAVDRTIE